MNQRRWGLGAFAETCVVAGLYAALTIVLAPLSYGPVQFRIPELLKSLVIWRPHLVAAFVLGNFLSNLTSPNVGPWELGFMPLANLVGAWACVIVGRRSPWAGAAAYAGLDSATTTEVKLDEEGRKWKNLIFFFGHLERDLACFVDRPVTGPGGENLRSMTGKTDQSGVSVDLSFTRLGRGKESSAPKRVGYRLNGDKIEALVWPALDSAPGSKPEIYEGVDGVESFEVNLGDGVSWFKEWNNDTPPKTVDVTVAMKSGEKIRRLFVLR